MTQPLNWFQRSILQMSGLDPEQIATKAKQAEDTWYEKNGFSPAQRKAMEALANYQTEQATRGMPGQVADFRAASGANIDNMRGVNNATLEYQTGQTQLRGEQVDQNTKAIGERTQFQTEADTARIGAKTDAALRILGGPVQQQELAVLDRFGSMYDRTLANSAAEREMLQAMAQQETGSRNVGNLLKGILGGAALLLG